VTDVADACVLRELFAAPALRRTAVVWTSNRAPTAVYSGGLNHSRIAPFVAALLQHHQVVNLDAPAGNHLRTERLAHDAPDYRRAALQADASPAACVVGAGAAARWTAAALRWSPCTLQVTRTRRLTVPRAADGVAVMSFDALCGAAQPVGRADYLALARQFHTLVLTHTPQLTRGK
jgi:cell division protein ZapE